MTTDRAAVGDARGWVRMTPRSPHTLLTRPRATRAVRFFDYLGIPYAQGVPDAAALPERHPLRSWDVLAFDGDAGRRCYVPPEPWAELTPPTRSFLGSIPLFTRLLPLDTGRRWLAGHGTWRPREPVRTVAGDTVSAVWTDTRGNVVLPFDPDEAILDYWSERYRRVDGGPAGRLQQRAVAGYYRVRPALPRRVQLALRRGYSRVQARSAFPRWPVETGLHDLLDWLLGLTAELAGTPVPWIAPWPDGHTWAVTLTHDVETETGYRSIHLLRAREERRGLRSCWNFVPERYRVDDAVVAELGAAGFEVGVHGLYHDGRDLDPALLAARLPAMRFYADRWQARGFRSPATHRDWSLMPRLGFDYDSSVPDTDPFEPQGGGCCSWWPFHNDDLIELPITLPQDHTLFEILGHTDERAWTAKVDRLRGSGGMALLLTHPDYMLTRDRLDAYDRFLARVVDRDDVWIALPRDLADWWRTRAASRLVRAGGGWRIAGPARSRGSIRLGAAGGGP